MKIYFAGAIRAERNDAVVPIFMRTIFCPSYHQKRVAEFGEWLSVDVLKKIPRRYFLYDRKLLSSMKSFCRL